MVLSLGKLYQYASSTSGVMPILDSGCELTATNIGSLMKMG